MGLAAACSGLRWPVHSPRCFCGSSVQRKKEMALIHRHKRRSKPSICQFDRKGSRTRMMAHVSQCFYKTLIADKYLLGYSNTFEHLNHFSGFVNPSRNTPKDSKYDAEIRGGGSSRSPAGGDGGFQNGSPNHSSSFLSFPLGSSLSMQGRRWQWWKRNCTGISSVPVYIPSITLIFRGEIASLFTALLTSCLVQDHIPGRRGNGCVFGAFLLILAASRHPLHILTCLTGWLTASTLPLLTRVLIARSLFK